MIRAGKCVFWTMIGISLAVSIAETEAEAGFLIRNPYVEGHRVINRPRLIGSTATGGHAGYASCVATCCGKTDEKPESTTATLRLWIAKDIGWAKVEVNGQPVDRQYLAGVHKGWLTCKLMGLTPGKSVIRTVRVTYYINKCEQQPTKQFAIVAGEVKSLHLTAHGFR